MGILVFVADKKMPVAYGYDRKNGPDIGLAPKTPPSGALPSPGYPYSIASMPTSGRRGGQGVMTADLFPCRDTCREGM